MASIISDKVKAKWDRERECYNTVKNMVMGYAIYTGLDCGAFGHTSVSVIAVVGREFLMKNTKYTYQDYVQYVFSTYGRHDESLWEDWNRGCSEGAEKRLFDAIEDSIITLKKQGENK